MTSPAAPAAASVARPRRSTSAHLWVGLVAAATATALGIVLALARLGGFWGVVPDRAPGESGVSGVLTPGAASDSARHPGRVAGAHVRGGWPIGPTTPLGVMAPPGPAQAPVSSSAATQPARRAMRGVPAPSAGQPAGRLAVWPAHLDLGQASSGSLVLGAVGGPVTWSGSTSSPEVALSSYAGSLSARATARLTVTVARMPQGLVGRSGQATIILGPGNLSVAVIWSATSATSATATPSGLPAAAPSTSAQSAGSSPSTRASGPPPSTPVSPSGSPSQTSASPAAPAAPAAERIDQPLAAAPGRRLAAPPPPPAPVPARPWAGPPDQPWAGPPGQPWAGPPGGLWAALAPAPAYGGQDRRWHWWRHARQWR